MLKIHSFIYLWLYEQKCVRNCLSGLQHTCWSDANRIEGLRVWVALGFGWGWSGSRCSWSISGAGQFTDPRLVTERLSVSSGWVTDRWRSCTDHSRVCDEGSRETYPMEFWEFRPGYKKRGGLHKTRKVSCWLERVWMCVCGGLLWVETSVDMQKQ